MPFLHRDCFLFDLAVSFESLNNSPYPPDHPLILKLDNGLTLFPPCPEVLLEPLHCNSDTLGVKDTRSLRWDSMLRIERHPEGIYVQTVVKRFTEGKGAQKVE